MSYIVRVGKYDYIANGNVYVVDGEPYVPLTSRSWEAKEYKTYSGALKATHRRGANMNEDKLVIHIDDSDGREIWANVTEVSKDGWY